MKQYLASEDRELFKGHGLASFEALWSRALPAVDQPNTDRGGWSAVFRLELEGRGYYVKRQCNHQIRTLRHPFGEPTLALEFRNIQRYRRLAIPALRAAYFAVRGSDEGPQAILVTRALEGWHELSHWLSDWASLPDTRREAILDACGALVRRLHRAGQRHGCLYPKHVFLRESDGRYESCLIDLEKNRPLLFGRSDRLRDLEPLVRRATSWSDEDLRRLIAAYLGRGATQGRIDGWLSGFAQRSADKASRG